MEKHKLTLLPVKLGVYRLGSGVSLPDWPADSSEFFSVTATADETSIVCREELIPADCPSESGFCALKVEGPLGFTLTGILSSILAPLAEAGISVFTISTYDTDYVLIKDEKLEQAINLLSPCWIILR